MHMKKFLLPFLLASLLISCGPKKVTPSESTVSEEEISESISETEELESDGGESEPEEESEIIEESESTIDSEEDTEEISEVESEEEPSEEESEDEDYDIYEVNGTSDSFPSDIARAFFANYHMHVTLPEFDLEGTWKYGAGTYNGYANLFFDIVNNVYPQNWYENTAKELFEDAGFAIDDSGYELEGYLATLESEPNFRAYFYNYYVSADQKTHFAIDIYGPQLEDFYDTFPTEYVISFLNLLGSTVESIVAPDDGDSPWRVSIKEDANVDYYMSLITKDLEGTMEQAYREKLETSGWYVEDRIYYLEASPDVISDFYIDFYSSSGGYFEVVAYAWVKGEEEESEEILPAEGSDPVMSEDGDYKVMTVTGGTFGTQTSAQINLEYEGLKITISQGSTAYIGEDGPDDLIRIFKSKTVTFEAEEIISITFNCVYPAGSIKWSPDYLTTNVGNYVASEFTGVWNGSESSVTFTASGEQVRANSIVIVYR